MPLSLFSTLLLFAFCFYRCLAIWQSIPGVERFQGYQYDDEYIEVQIGRYFEGGHPSRPNDKVFIRHIKTGVYTIWLQGQGAIDEMALYDIDMQAEGDLCYWVGGITQRSKLIIHRIRGISG